MTWQMWRIFWSRWRQTDAGDATDVSAGDTARGNKASGGAEGRFGSICGMWGTCREDGR